MKKEPFVYGLIGLIVGVLFMGFIANYAVNSEHRGMMQMMGMNNRQMKTDNVDKHFIEQMIPHHESAITMANQALLKTKHEEVKALANNIISSQSAEINTMKDWYKDWYGVDVPKLSLNQLHGGEMMNGQASADELSNASDYDEAFLSQMIAHHQMAVMMANMLSTSTNRTEMKKLANEIIDAQNKEINDMQNWQQQWGYETSASDKVDMMGH